MKVGSLSSSPRTVYALAAAAILLYALAAWFLLVSPKRAEAARLQDDVLPEVPRALVVPAVAAWTQLFGTVGFELFGQYEQVVVDRAAFLDAVADAAATAVGLP